MIHVEEFRQAAEEIGRWGRTLILTHDRPDGDALGACIAMKRSIESAGRKATILLAETCPVRYTFLAEQTPLYVWPSDRPTSILEGFDGILVLDTCSLSQLAPFRPLLTGCPLPRVVLDHHATRDDLSDGGAPVTYLIDSSAASACSLVYRWCQAAGWPIDTAIAEALFVGLVTDTGWYRFSNTDAETFQIAGHLVEQGARPDIVYGRLYEMWPTARLRIKALALSTIELHADARLALMHLDPAMFAQAGATPKDTEELVNEPMAAGSVMVSILFVQEEDGRLRASFRSKSPQVCGIDIDIAALASQFGGGGHRRAAGARLEGEWGALRDRIIAAACQAIKESC